MTEHDCINRLFFLLYFHKHIFKSDNLESIIVKNNITMVLTFAICQMGLYEEYREYELMRYCKENNSIFKNRKTTL